MKTRLFTLLTATLLLSPLNALAATEASALDLVRTKNAITLEQALKQGSSPNLTDTDGNSLLILAIEQEKYPLVPVLLANKANVNHSNKLGETALMMAAMQGEVLIMQQLLDKGAQLNTLSKSGESALVYAASFGQLQALEFLLAQGLRATDQQQRAFLSACRYGYPNIASYFIKQGISVNIQDSLGTTPLLSATQAGNAELINLLLDHKANVNLLNHKKLDAMFGILAEKQLDEDVKANLVARLIEKGIDLNRTYTAQSSALSIAIMLKHFKAARIIAKHQKNLNMVDQDGFTPLLALAHVGPADDPDAVTLMKEILEKGANPVALQKLGDKEVSAFELASAHGNYPFIKLMLENGVEANATSSTGTPMLIYFISINRPDLVKLMLEHKADPSVKIEGRSALQIAEEEGFKEVEAILKQYGAK